MYTVTVKSETGNRNRYLSLGSLCLGSVCVGLTIGWPESSFTYLLLMCGDDTIYRYHSGTDRETIPIIMNFGSCIGALVPSCIADFYGRKFSFAIAGIMNFVFWVILIGFRGHVAIMVSAAIGGFGAGIFVATSVLYVNEISLPRTRGAVGALFAFSAYVGVLFGSCLIFITFLRTVALIMACLAMSFIATLNWWMIESPYFFFMRGKTLDTKLSLKLLRGAPSILDIDHEYKAIELLYINENAKNVLRDGSQKSWIFGAISIQRIYTISVILFLCITQMVGAYGMDDYSKSFIDVLLPNCGGIVISSMDIFSFGICLFFIEKIRRRSIFLTISIVGSSLSCFILSIFILVDRVMTNQHDSEESMILSAVILIPYYIIYSFGLIPLLPILTSELFPSRYRTTGLSICISFIYLLSFLIAGVFDILIECQGSNLAFVSFSIFSCLGIPFIFTLPSESGGKIIYEILSENVAVIIP